MPLGAQVVLDPCQCLGIGRIERRQLAVNVKVAFRAGGESEVAANDGRGNDGGCLIDVKRPQQLAIVRVERLDKAAHAILAAIRADQDLAVHRGRRHGFAVAKRGIGDVDLPHNAAGLGVEGDQLGIERAHEERVAENGDPAIVRAAAHARIG